MYIETNLDYNFGKFEDLLLYMQEENIKEVKVKIDFVHWGIKFPKELLTVADIEKIIKEFKELN